MIGSLSRSKNNVTVEGNVNAFKTIVFAHGFGTDQTAWNWIKHAFADDYRLVLFDNVGAGEADPHAFDPLKYDSLDAYADDMLHIMAELELYNATIVAHSVSVMVAMLTAIRAPEYFSQMVFIGASPRYLDDALTGYSGGFNQEALDGMYAVMGGNYMGWVSGFSSMAMANPHLPELVDYFADTLSALSPDLALHVAKVIFESDVREHLSKLNKEVLLLQATGDIAVPLAVAKYLHRHIKGSKLVQLKATGHFPHISAPGEVIRHIQDFL
jgi:sigma-B regulation protein RsbQ